MLKGKKILLGITGSIAAYKAATLTRLLVKGGAEVRIIMTAAAKDFIPALTLSTLSKNEVLSDLFEKDTWNQHVALGRWADLMVVAPASCNSIAKMATGVCDNLLHAVYLSAVCPVMLAPAMDEDMWKHPSTKANLATLQRYGNVVLPVENGELASGLSGEGRMAEPETIIQYIDRHFQKKNDLQGKNVLISAGPTHEAIDPVRFIGNHSSGKMGLALAASAKARGAGVTVVIGPSTESIPQGIELIRVKTAEEMYSACIERFPHADVAIMCAAVADFTPAMVAPGKIKKNGAALTLELKPTADILKKMGELKTHTQVVAGFALETENEEENAMKKLVSKKADFIILNSLNDSGAGFGSDDNKITIFDKTGNRHAFGLKSKSLIASDIIDTIINKNNA